MYVLVFLSLGGVAAQNWQAINCTLDGAVRSLMPDTTNDQLVVGGEFFFVNGNLQKSIAAWNDTTMISAGSFGCNPLFSLGRWRGDIYATDCNQMLRSHNGSWSVVGSGFNGSAICYYATDSLLYVGGGFNSINSVETNGLAVWNGINWASTHLPAGRGSVDGIAMLQGQLYVVGQFQDSTGEDMITKVFKLNCGCRGWADISYAIAGPTSWAGSMIVYKGELYVAGSFSKADGSIGNSIIRYDGTAWHDVAGGMVHNGSYGQVFTMHVFNDILYVGGFFEAAGDSVQVLSKNIVAWDGNRWYGLGGDFNQSILAICDWKNELYIGGRFTLIDNMLTYHFAKYTGILP